MKKLLCLCVMLSSMPLFAQQRQVKVLLFSNQGLSSLRISPRGQAAIDGIAIKSGTAISVASGRLAIEGRTTASRNARVTGTFAVETAGNAPVTLQQPLDVGVEGSRLRLLITEALEEYVGAVLAGEASTFRSMESLKA